MPETWYGEARECNGVRIIVDVPGCGYVHAVSREVLEKRLCQFPPEMLVRLVVVKLSTMTRKRASAQLSGMQWGGAVYLYPVPESGKDTCRRPPSVSEKIEIAKCGGKWEISPSESRISMTRKQWELFCLECVFPHELAHLNDDRNTNFRDRERYAEYMAQQLGKPCESYSRRKPRSRHGRKRRR